jgi:Mg-chelatase subunit ChlD
LALFLKGKADGEDRDENVRLNLIICLDVSGSMGCGLSLKQGQNDKHKSRLSLSIEAIKMLISKLKPNDSIGMVVFSDDAETIFECTMKKDIQIEEMFQKIDQISTRGGTTIIEGFKMSN